MKRLRYHVIPEYNHHGGTGWAIFDRERQRVDGGWFADRIAAERTADTLNQSDAPVHPDRPEPQTPENPRRTLRYE